jgi:tRNA 2-selenouridine synthase
MMLFKVANLSQLTQFDEVIDVRSPAEFAEDHIPGAINCPVLDDQQRAEVGTLYCQQSPFAARKLGAVLVARNIAQHIEQQFQDRPKSWRPLIYCWRGGQRSAAMAIILGQIGWSAHQLQLGYKAYRHQVLDDLEHLPAAISFCVLSGPTGSGKSRFLAALARQGQATLDLEQLAGHRGSVLGALPDRPQPSQKSFESALRQQLLQFPSGTTVYVEAESRMIGRIALPNALLAAIRSGDCLQLQVPGAERLRFLLQDYAHFTLNPTLLLLQLERLRGIYANEQLTRWEQLVYQGKYQQLVEALLEVHYDPLYRRSTGKNFSQSSAARQLSLPSLADAALDQAARILGDHSPR